MRAALNWFGSAVYDVFVAWIDALCVLFRDAARRSEHRKRLKKDAVRCQAIPADVYKRPDPLIYCQQYLMAHGLAVTWDNPDIQLYRDGVAVPSSGLEPDTEYEVRANIWNSSTAAPAIGMPVDFSYLNFGIGTHSHSIGTTTVDVNVKGSPLLPAVAQMVWRTPVVPGHYCLQTRLRWSDDANPDNNLGQENTQVGVAHSPARFEFETRNDQDRERRITLVSDSYTLPPLLNCEDVVIPGRGVEGRSRLEMSPNLDMADADRQAWCAAAARQHDPADFPVPRGWTMAFEPQPPFHLGPNESQPVTVHITPPDGWTGIQAINVAGIDAEDGTPLGGVTLYTKR